MALNANRMTAGGNHWRVMVAVARKEWQILRRYPSWVAAILIWPILMPYVYLFAARALSGPDNVAVEQFAAHAGTQNYVNFILLGTLIWGWLNMTLWDVGVYLRSEQMRGTLESNWLTPAGRFTMLLGASLLKMIFSAFSLAITALEYWLLFGIQLVQGQMGLLLGVLALLWLSVFGIGLAFASVVLRFKQANSLVFIVRGIFMVFCGITFPITVMPGWMQGIAAWLPLTYGIRALRAITLEGAGLAEIWSDVLALGAFGIVLPLSGFLAFRVMERYARRSGSLGHY